MKKISCIILTAGWLTACSSYYTSNGEKQYLESRNGERLLIPPPLTDSNISHFYDLPNPEGSTNVSVAPPEAQ